MNNTKILEELTKLAKSNDDIGIFGDGYEKAINEAIRVVKNCSIQSVSSNEVKLKFNYFVNKQQDLDSEFVKIVNDNFWDLL